MISARQPAAFLLVAALSGVLSACQADSSGTARGADGPAPTAPVLQPGKPGEPNVSITNRSAALPAPPADPDDTRFMQEMISHHAQALRIVAVARSLLTDTQAKAIAGRIEAGQRPEIDAMARWLTEHGQNMPPEAKDPLMTPNANHHTMPGMASEAQLGALARARASEADRIFLTLMITHHRGALTMALDQRTHGTDDRVTEVSDDISVTQTAEIGHMSKMLTRLGAPG